MTRTPDMNRGSSGIGRMQAAVKVAGEMGEAVRVEDRWIVPSAIMKDLEISPRRERRLLVAYVGTVGVPESPAEASWTREGYLTLAVRLAEPARDEKEADAIRGRLAGRLADAGLGLVYADILPRPRLPEHPFFSAMRDLLGEVGRGAGDALRRYRQEPEEFLAAWNRDHLAFVRGIVRERAHPLLQAECRSFLAPVLRVVCYNARGGLVQVADFAREEVAEADEVRVVVCDEDLSLIPGPLGEDACRLLSQVIGRELSSDRLVRVASHWSVYSPSYGNLNHPFLVAFDDICRRMQDLNKLLRPSVPRNGGSIKAEQYELWERQRIQTTRELIATGAFKESDATARWRQPARVYGLVLARPDPGPAEMEDAGGLVAVAAFGTSSPEREAVRFIVRITDEIECDPVRLAIGAHNIPPEVGSPIWTYSRPLGSYLKDKPSSSG
ncbi:MAG: hypothetical protein N3A38_11395 [Planctomycetota bacterium]|nr:hypothetical protein [Planctomycetota bacterium]